jgi:hypothetical protein
MLLKSLSPVSRIAQWMRTRKGSGQTGENQEDFAKGNP